MEPATEDYRRRLTGIVNGLAVKAGHSKYHAAQIATAFVRSVEGLIMAVAAPGMQQLLGGRLDVQRIEEPPQELAVSLDQHADGVVTLVRYASAEEQLLELRRAVWAVAEQVQFDTDGLNVVATPQAWHFLRLLFLLVPSDPDAAASEVPT